MNYFVATSTLRVIGPVTFPPFTGERVYMIPFTQQYGLPVKLARWQPTVDAMLTGIQTDRTIYLMIDQAEVAAGECHRRPGPHVDGKWLSGENTHGHRSYMLKNELIIFASDVEASVAYLGEFSWPRTETNPWAYQSPPEKGDCSNVDLSGMQKVPMKANTAYLGTGGTIHESLPIKKGVRRTMVRLNLAGKLP